MASSSRNDGVCCVTMAPLRRAIMRLLEDSMAERMLGGEIKEGDSAIIDVDGGK